MINASQRRKTLRAMIQSGAFVLGFPGADQVSEADYPGVETGYNTDKPANVGYTTSEGKTVHAPIIYDEEQVQYLSLGGKIADAFKTGMKLKSDIEEVKHHMSVQVDMDELDLIAAESKDTNEEIQEWIQEKYGFHVSHLNISQEKRKHGIIERENYNKPKSSDSRQPGCPKEKMNAIEEALKFFQMI